MAGDMNRVEDNFCLESGQVVNEYDYDAYGCPEIISALFPQPFLYTAREWEPEAEPYHYRARAYDADTGRFFQEDPIWFGVEDLDLHRYDWNNPLKLYRPKRVNRY